MPVLKKNINLCQVAQQQPQETDVWKEVIRPDSAIKRSFLGAQESSSLSHHQEGWSDGPPVLNTTLSAFPASAERSFLGAQQVLLESSSSRPGNDAWRMGPSENRTVQNTPLSAAEFSFLGAQPSVVGPSALSHHQDGWREGQNPFLSAYPHSAERSLLGAQQTVLGSSIASPRPLENDNYRRGHSEISSAYPPSAERSFLGAQQTLLGSSSVPASLPRFSSNTDSTYDYQPSSKQSGIHINITVSDKIVIYY